MSQELTKATYKCSFKKFCRDKQTRSFIQEKVIRVHQIISEAYQLANLHFRRLLENSEELPSASKTRNFFAHFTKAITCSGNAVKIDEQVLLTYNTRYLPIRQKYNLSKLSRNELNKCLAASRVEMETCFLTNIQTHFFKRQYRYLRLANLDKEPREVLELLRTLNEHPPSNKVGVLYLPDTIEVSVAYDLEKDPMKYLRPMFRMLQYMENIHDTTEDPKLKKWSKPFSLVPLRRAFVPNYIHIDHETILDWFGRKEENRLKSVYLLTEVDIMAIPEGQRNEKTLKRKQKELRQKENRENEVLQALKNNIWKTLFNFKRFHNSKKWTFAKYITTDGISVSAVFERESKIAPYQLVTQGLKGKKRKKMSPIGVTPVPVNAEERKVVGIDPGKCSILYMTTDDKEKSRHGSLDYTVGRRAHETKRRKHQRRLLKKKKDHNDFNIQALEDVISKCNSRACSVKDFEKYLDARGSVEEKLYFYYSHKIFRAFRWKSYQATAQSEHALVEDIKKRYGANAILAYGKWDSPHQYKGCEPTPTCRMRTLLKRHFEVIDTPEYLTTKTCSKCMQPTMTKCKTRASKTNPKVQVEVRGLRRCSNSQCGVYMNRDYNAAMNIRKNCLYWIEHKGLEWHPAFTRSTSSDTNNNNTMDVRKKVRGKRTKPICSPCTTAPSRKKAKTTTPSTHGKNSATSASPV